MNRLMIPGLSIGMGEGRNGPSGSEDRKVIVTLNYPRIVADVIAEQLLIPYARLEHCFVGFDPVDARTCSVNITILVKCDELIRLPLMEESQLPPESVGPYIYTLGTVTTIAKTSLDRFLRSKSLSGSFRLAIGYHPDGGIPGPQLECGPWQIELAETHTFPAIQQAILNFLHGPGEQRFQ